MESVRFCPPRSTSTLIARPLLSARIENGGKLTLLLAPAGSGKSTLLAQWSERAGSSDRVAWLLCGHRDRNPVYFFASLAASIHQALDISHATAVVSASTAHSSADHVVDTLNDRLGMLEGDLIIAIDDLQCLDCG